MLKLGSDYPISFCATCGGVVAPVTNNVLQLELFCNVEAFIVFSCKFLCFSINYTRFKLLLGFHEFSFLRLRAFHIYKYPVYVYKYPV